MKSWQIISGFQSGPRKRDTRIILVDDDVHQVGDHDEGEIVIAGPSVSKGYINNPEKTAKAFLEIEGTPAYRTGDLGQFDENGQLLYKGRMDSKLRFTVSELKWKMLITI